MNKILKILCGVACAFVFCFLAIGYAAVQDELRVTGSVSVMPQDKVFAVYGEAFDSNGESLGMALNFYNRSVPALNGTIELIGADGMKYGSQTVTEIYENLAAFSWAGYAGTVESVAVVDAGVQPESTASWFSGFSQCIKFDLANLDTSALTDMNAMFYGCSAVTDLNLSNFNTQNVNHMSQMFKDCSSLDRILVSEAFTVTSASTSAEVFSGCIALKGGAGTTVNNNVGTYYARIDGGSTAPGYFTYYKYSVVFEPNHKTLSGEVVATVPEKMLSKNNTFTIPAAPTHKWATFLGWATTSTADETTTLYQPGDTFTSSAGEPCCDVLYAIWDLGITNQTELDAAIAEGKGTVDDPLVFGGGEWSTLTVENKEIAIYDGQFNSISRLDKSNVTIYGGSFNFYYMWIQGATVTIKEGNFTNTSGFINPGDGVSTLIIEGGNFNWKGISNSSSSSEVIITGGEFRFDPTAYVDPAECTVIDHGNGTWEVVSIPNVALVNEKEEPTCTCETKCADLNDACEVCKADISFCKGTKAPAENDPPADEQGEQPDAGEEQTTPPNDPPADEPSSDDGQSEQPTEGAETTTPSDVSGGDVVETEETQTHGDQNASESEETSEPVVSSDPVILPSEDGEDGEEPEQPQDTENDQQGQE